MQASNDQIAVELQKRLLSNNDRAQIEKARTHPELTYYFIFKNATLHVFGMRHLSADTDNIVSSINSEIDYINPDILLVEASKQVLAQASNDTQINQLPDNQQPEAILQKYGEQTYFGWSAQHRGRLVDTWDLPLTKQLQIAAQATSPQAVISWLSLYATKNLVQLGHPATPTSVLELIERFNQRADQLSQTLSTKVTPDTLQQAAEQSTHQPYSQLAKNPQLLSDLTKPDTTHPTNLAFLAMNIARDKYAMEIMYQAMQQYQSVTATCGSAHATTWQPALKWLSNQQ